MLAQGYQANQNVTIDIFSGSTHAPNFPTTKLASNTGVLTYTWTSIPYNLALGNYTIRLSSNPAKAVRDAQAFEVDPANVTIAQLSVTQSSLERTQTEGFRFTATYPNLAKVTTGSATLRIIEADGLTEHDVVAIYKTTLAQYNANYLIQPNGTLGAWTASIDIGGFNDGYGNTGPSASVPRAFAVSTAILNIAVTTNKYNYTTGNVVAITAHVVTPGGANFTSGTVSTASFLSGREVRNPIQLSYDQTRGIWVGGYTLNATDPAGVWLVQVNATDSYGNSGSGSTSVLFSQTPTQPPNSQPPSNPSILAMLTSNFLILLVIALGAVLAIIGSWVLFRRGRISRKVLRVDLEAVHSEAAKIENDAFFQHVRDQLKEARKPAAEGEEKT